MKNSGKKGKDEEEDKTLKLEKPPRQVCVFVKDIHPWASAYL